MVVQCLGKVRHLVRGSLRCDADGLRDDHLGQSLFYYIDVPFEETMLLLGNQAAAARIARNQCSSEALA